MIHAKRRCNTVTGCLEFFLACFFGNQTTHVAATEYYYRQPVCGRLVAGPSLGMIIE